MIKKIICYVLSYVVMITALVPYEIKAAEYVVSEYDEDVLLSAQVEELIKGGVVGKQEIVEFKYNGTIEEVQASVAKVLSEVNNNVKSYSMSYGKSGETLYVKISFTYREITVEPEVNVETDIEKVIKEGIQSKKAEVAFNYAGTIEEVGACISKVLGEIEHSVKNYSLSYAQLEEMIAVKISFTYRETTVEPEVNVETDIEKVIKEGVQSKKAEVAFNYAGTIEEVGTCISKVLGEIEHSVKNYSLSYAQLEEIIAVKISFTYRETTEEPEVNVETDIEKVIKEGVQSKKVEVAFNYAGTIEEVGVCINKVLGEIEHRVKSYGISYVQLEGMIAVKISFIYKEEIQVDENIEQMIQEAVQNKQQIIEFNFKGDPNDVATFMEKLKEEENSIKTYTVSYILQGEIVRITVEVKYKDEKELIQSEIQEGINQRKVTLELSCKLDTDVIAIVEPIMETAAFGIDSYTMSSEIIDGILKVKLNILYKTKEDVQSDLENKLRTAFQSKQKQVEVKYLGTNDEVVQMIAAIKSKINNQTPLIDSVNSWEYTTNTSEVGQCLLLTITYDSELGEEEGNKQAFVKQQLAYIINDITSASMNEHEKVKSIFDYVVKNYSYDYTYTHYQLYDVLANKNTICDGYANLTYQLCTLAGIESRVVKNDTHAWNLIKVDGNWYHVDTTHAAGIGRYPYTYYLLNTEEVLKFSSHEYNEAEYPVANVKYLDTIRDIQEYQTLYQIIVAGKSSGEAYFNEEELELNINDSSERIIPFTAVDKEHIVLKSSNEKIVAVAGNQFKTVGIGETDIFLCTTAGDVICKAHVTVVNCGIDDIILDTKIEKRAVFSYENTENKISAKVRKKKEIKSIDLWIQDENEEWMSKGQLLKDEENQYSSIIDFADMPLGEINCKVVATDNTGKTDESAFVVNYTDVNLEEIDRFNELMSQKIDEIFATNENLSSKELIEVLSDFLIRADIVEKIWVEDKGIRITYKGGVENYIRVEDEEDNSLKSRGGKPGNIVASVSDEKWEYVDISSNKVLIWSPCETDWGNHTEVEAIKKMLEESKIDFQVDVLTDKQANIESLKEINDYGIIIFISHGLDGKYLAADGTGVWYNPKEDKMYSNAYYKYRNEFVSEEIMGMYELDVVNKTYKCYYLMSDKWFENNLGTLANSIVINNSCESLATDQLSNAFLNHGAAAYFGYSSAITNAQAVENAVEIMKALVIDNVSTSTAQVSLHNELNGGSSFKLAGSKNAMATNAEMGFENDLSKWQVVGDAQIAEGCVVEDNKLSLAYDGKKSCILTNQNGYSEVSRTVTIPKNATTLRFDWLYGTTTSNIPNIAIEIEGEGIDPFYGWLYPEATQEDPHFYMLKTETSYLEKEGLLHKVNGGSYAITDWENMHYKLNSLYQGKEFTIKFRLEDNGSSDGFSFACIDNIRFLDERMESYEETKIKVALSPNDILTSYEVEEEGEAYTKNAMNLKLVITNIGNTDILLEDIYAEYLYTADNDDKENYPEVVETIKSLTSNGEDLLGKTIAYYEDEEEGLFVDSKICVEFNKDSGVLKKGEYLMLDIIVNNNNIDARYILENDYSYVPFVIYDTDDFERIAKDMNIKDNYAVTEYLLGGVDKSKRQKYKGLEIGKEEIDYQIERWYEALSDKMGDIPNISLDGYKYLVLYEMPQGTKIKISNPVAVKDSSMPKGKVHVKYSLEGIKAHDAGKDNCLTLGIGTAIKVIDDDNSDTGIDHIGVFKNYVEEKTKGVFSYKDADAFKYGIKSSSGYTDKYALYAELMNDAYKIAGVYPSTQETYNKYWISTELAYNLLNRELEKHLKRIHAVNVPEGELKEINIEQWELDALVMIRYNEGHLNNVRWLNRYRKYKKDIQNENYGDMTKEAFKEVTIEEWKQDLEKQGKLNDRTYNELRLLINGDYTTASYW